MLLFLLTVLCVLGHSSCLLSGSESLPSREDSGTVITLRGDDEGMDDSYLSILKIQEVRKSVEKQLDAYRDHISEKMSSLERACKNTAKSPALPSGIEYKESTEFKDPRMIKLVEIMTEKIQDVAEIFKDDLTTITHNVSVLLAESIEERFSPLMGDFGILYRQTEGLAQKIAVDQIADEISDLASTTIKDLKQSISTMASKSQFIAITENFASRTRLLQEATTTGSTCEDFDPLLETTLMRIAQASEKMADAKYSWMNAQPTCPMIPEELLSALNSAATERKDTVASISRILDNVGSGVFNRLEELILLLKGTYVLRTSTPPTSHSTVAITPTASTDVIEAVLDDAACQDSTFVGPIALPDICGRAVQLGRCATPFLSFHCCATCHTAGFRVPLSVLDESRVVPVLKALQALMPTLADISSSYMGSLNPVTFQYQRPRSPFYPSNL